MKTSMLKIKASVWILLPLIVLVIPFATLSQAGRTVSLFAVAYFVLMGVWFGARFAKASVPLSVIFILGGANAAVFAIVFLAAKKLIFDVTWLALKLYGGLFFSVGNEIITVFTNSALPHNDWTFLLGGYLAYFLIALIGIVLMVVFFLLGFLFARGYLYGRRVENER